METDAHCSSVKRRREKDRKKEKRFTASNDPIQRELIGFFHTVELEKSTLSLKKNRDNRMNKIILKTTGLVYNIVAVNLFK